MAKVQTRKSISLSGRVYDVLKVYCEVNNLSMSACVEAAIRDRLGIKNLPGDKGTPVVEPLEELVVQQPAPPPPQEELPRSFGVLVPPPRKQVEVVQPCRREKCHRLDLHEAHE